MESILRPVRHGEENTCVREVWSFAFPGQQHSLRVSTFVVKTTVWDFPVF